MSTFPEVATLATCADPRKCTTAAAAATMAQTAIPTETATLRIREKCRTRTSVLGTSTAATLGRTGWLLLSEIGSSDLSFADIRCFQASNSAGAAQTRDFLPGIRRTGSPASFSQD